MLDGKRTKLTRKITRPKGLTNPRHHRGVLSPSRPVIATKPHRKVFVVPQDYDYNYGLGTTKLHPEIPERLGRTVRALRELDAGVPPADIYDHFINGLTPVELSALELALRGIDTCRRAVAPSRGRRPRRASA